MYFLMMLKGDDLRQFAERAAARGNLEREVAAPVTAGNSDCVRNNNGLVQVRTRSRLG